MNIPQRYLTAAAVIIGFVLVEYWVWSGMFAKVSDKIREVEAKISPARKATVEAEALVAGEQQVYEARKQEWFTKRGLRDADGLEADLKDSRVRIEQLKTKAAKAREALQIAATQTEAQIEMVRALNGLATRLGISDADRRVGRPTVSIDRETNACEITVEFRFVARPDVIVRLLSGELDAVLSYTAIDSALVRPANDNEIEAINKRLELTGRLVGYFYPRGWKPPTVS